MTDYDRCPCPRCACRRAGGSDGHPCDSCVSGVHFTGPPASDECDMPDCTNNADCGMCNEHWGEYVIATELGRASDAGLRALVGEFRGEANASEKAVEVKIREGELGTPDLIWVASEGALIGTYRNVADRIEAALNAPAAAVCDVAADPCDGPLITDIGVDPDRCNTHVTFMDKTSGYRSGKFEAAGGKNA